MNPKPSWQTLLRGPGVKPDKVPADWKTRHQLAKEHGISIDAVHTRVTSGVRAGKIECRKFNIAVNEHTVRPVPHYKVKQ